MKRVATILLAILALGITAYISYAAGETQQFGKLCFYDDNDEKLEAYGERIRQLTNLNRVEYDIIMQYDSALASLEDKDELMMHANRLEMLWDVYHLLMAKYSADEDTTYLPPLEYYGTEEEEIEEDVDGDIEEEEMDESKDLTQAEMNDTSEKGLVKYKEKVEKEYQKVLSSYPKYKALFQKEKSLWEKYYESVQDVARYGDHGSSEPMYYYDVLRQAIKLRHDALNYVLLHSQGKKYPLYRTKFTLKMVDDAYTAFVDAANLLEEFDEKELKAYQASLRHEQKLWCDWINYRNTISKKMTAEVSKAYDNCTNLAIRSKLRQVKNQNKALGVTGHEIWDCILPEKCSDKALLEYPGFDKVWAKHCEDTDWYPVFD